MVIYWSSYPIFRLVKRFARPEHRRAKVHGSKELCLAPIRASNHQAIRLHRPDAFPCRSPLSKDTEKTANLALCCLCGEERPVATGDGAQGRSLRIPRAEMGPAGEDEVANVDGVLRLLEDGGKAATELEEVEEGDAAGGVGRKAVRGRSGHPGGKDVIVSEEYVLRVPVVDVQARRYGGQVGHGGLAESLQGGCGQIDHVLLGLAESESVQDHGEDEAKPAPTTENLVLQRPWLLKHVYMALANLCERIIMDSQKWHDLSLSSGKDFDPIVDDGLQTKQIAHGVWKSQ